MVVQLIKKDLTYLVTSLRSTLIMLIIFSLCLPMGSISFGCIIPGLVCYIGFYNTLAYEERNKMDILNLSLPVRRQEICLAKYMEALIYMIGACILASIGMTLNLKGSSHNLLFGNGVYELIPIMLVIAMIYSAVIIPCVFYFGTLKSRYVLLAVYIVIFMGATNIESDVLVNGIKMVEQIGNGHADVVSILIAIVLFIISYGISLRIWQHKEI